MSLHVAILGGTGPAGGGLAQRFARAGLRVTIGSRNAERARTLAKEFSEKIGKPGAIAGDENRATLAQADIVVLTVPFEGHAELLKQLKPAFRPGIPVVDATVPLAASVGGRPTRVLGVWQGSVAQQTAELVPKGVPVVAAFHNVSAGLLEGDKKIECDVIVCSDDPEAQKKVFALVDAVPGLRALDGGKLENARIVEQVTALLINLNIRYKVHSAGLRITGLPIADK